MESPTKKEDLILNGHFGSVYSVDFPPNGKYFAHGSKDQIKIFIIFKTKKSLIWKATQVESASLFFHPMIVSFQVI